MQTSLAQAFARHVCSATARQLALGDVLGERGWAVDVRKGIATFAELSFPIQLLGTEAEDDNTWLWAWANESSSLPESILRSARDLCAMGESRGLEFLSTPGFSLEGMSGHQVAMVCTGLLGTGPYYRGPYDGGALYFAIENIQLPEVDGPRINTVLMQVISTFEVDHRVASHGFLDDLGYAVTENTHRLEGKNRSGTTVWVDFDSAGRISNLEVSIQGRST